MLYLKMGVKQVRNSLHQGLSSFLYSEGSPHPCQGDCLVQAIVATQEFRWEALEEDWGLGGRGRTRMLGCECLPTVPAGICPLGCGYPARAVLAHSSGCLNSSGSCFSQHHHLCLCLGLGAAPLPCHHQVPTLPL